jgi:cupin superfamily acireductone dioxygenase involved in methionine salvage
MSLLVIYDEKGYPLLAQKDYKAISQSLDKVGVLFERWRVKPVKGQEDILRAYQDEILRINETFHFVSVDVAEVLFTFTWRTRFMQWCAKKETL